MEQIHATALDVAGSGVLLCGPSGAGKSDLALRLMDRGATFIADDQVLVRKASRGLVAEAPEKLRGYLEIRGIGITSVPTAGGTFVRLIIDLVEPEQVPRLPEKEYRLLLGEKIPLLRMNAFEVSSPVKIELAAANPLIIGGCGPDE